MSTTFLTATSTNDANRPPETDAAGTVTRWLAVPTAFPSQERCSNALLSSHDGALVGFDPGYAVTVDASVRCWPSEATTWRSQADPRTTTSLGPVACPEQYYTAAISEKDESSTLIACCPSDYTFNPNAPVSIVAPVSQCISSISEGQSFEFASNFGGDSGWLKTSTTATVGLDVVGIPINGWQFRRATTAALVTSAPTSTASSSNPVSIIAASSASSASTTSSAPTALAIPDDELSTRAKVGIGVGVGIGVLMAAIILLWVFLDPLARMRHRRNADRVEAASRAQGRGRSPEPTYQSPTPPSLREIVLGSPTPASMGSPGWGDRPREVSPLPPSEIMSLSSSGAGEAQRVEEPQDMTNLQYHDDAAPAPVVGGIGIGRTGSAQSRYGASAQSAGGKRSEWIVTPGQPRHERSGSLQSLYAIGSYRRPSTARSAASAARSGPAVGLWGIDPTGKAGRSDSVDYTSRSGSVSQPGRDGSVSQPGRSASIDHPGRSGSTSSQQSGVAVAGPSGVGRSSSQRSARIVMSPIEMAGQRYDMALEISDGRR